MLDFFWKSDVYSMGLTILDVVGLRVKPEPYWNDKENIHFKKRLDDIY